MGVDGGKRVDRDAELRAKTNMHRFGAGNPKFTSDVTGSVTGINRRTTLNSATCSDLLELASIRCT